MRKVMLAAALWAATTGTASAQQRPLTTEDPETLTTGLVLIEAGVDHLREIYFPLSGLQGNLTRLPTLGVSVGIGPIAEVQIDGGLYKRLAVTSRRAAPMAHVLDFTGNNTTDVEDIVVATKIKFLSEAPGRPAMGLRFATRLPNASNESGLGQDTTDFSASLLVGKTVQSIRVVANAGLGILGDPLRGDRQNDVFLFGVSLARAVRQGVELVGEVDVRANARDEEDTPPGTETRARMVFGGRFTRGTVRLDSGVIVGMTSRDPSIGFTAGLTWVFTGFTIP
jgi:hypothetical protein